MFLLGDAGTAKLLNYYYPSDAFGLFVNFSFELEPICFLAKTKNPPVGNALKNLNFSSMLLLIQAPT